MMGKKSLLFFFTLLLMFAFTGGGLLAAETCSVTVRTGTSPTSLGDKNIQVAIYDSAGTEVSSTVTAGSITAYTQTQINVMPGTYTYTGYFAYTNTAVGSGRFEVTEDGQVITLKNVYFPEITNAEDAYTNKVWNADKTYAYASGDAGNSFLLPALDGNGHYIYAFVPEDSEKYWGSNGDLYVYATIAADSFIGLNLSDGGSFIVKEKVTMTVKVPKGADIGFYHRVKFYRPLEAMEMTYVGEEGEYDVYTVEAPKASIHYELLLDGKIKQARMVTPANYAETALVIDEDDLADDATQIIRDETQSFFDASLLLNVNNARYLAMNVSDYFDIYCYRNWQAISSITGNYYVDPEYHYTVSEGDSVTVDENGRITAVKEGVSVIQVTYDALDWVGLDAKPMVYSAIYPENTGVIVVSVGADQSANIKTNINRSAEYETIYYTKSVNGVETGEQSAEYTFTPTADAAISVRVQRPLQTDWDEGWETYTANEDGSFTVKLYDGRNIIEVKAGDSVEYHVLRAYGLDLSIVDTKTGAEIGDSVPVGTTLAITFNGINSPLAKLGAVYNPGFPDGIYIVYDYDGQELEGTHTQYTLNITNTLYVTCDEAGEYTLTDGKIHTNVLGGGLAMHRGLTLGGNTGTENSFGSDGMAGTSFDGYMCSLPDISIEVVGEVDEAAQAALDFCHINASGGYNPSISLGDDNIATATVTNDTDLVQVLTSERNASSDSYRSLSYKVQPDNATELTAYLRYWTEKNATPQIMEITIGQTNVTNKFSRYDDVTYAELILVPDESTNAYNKTYSLRVSNYKEIVKNTVNPYYGNTAFLSGLEVVMLDGLAESSTLHGLLKADPITYTDSSSQVQTLDLGYGFLGTELNYTATVPGTTTQIQILPTALVEGAATVALTVNGETVASGEASQTIDLVEGANLITVVNTTGADTKTYTVNVFREDAPRTVTFVGETGMSVVVYDEEGAKYKAADDGSFSLYPGVYTYYAACSGYLTKSGSFTVIKSDENTVTVGAMDTVPQQSGIVSVVVTSVSSILRNSQITMDQTPYDLAKQKYVDYNNGGYTALHAMVAALDSGTIGVDFTCKKGVLIPDVDMDATGHGENAGWVCEVNGVAVNPASTLVYNGDKVEFYYNPDYEGMRHASFDTAAKTVEAGKTVTLTLTSTPIANSGSAGTAVAGADIYVNGRDSGINTDANGQAVLNAFPTAGKYIVTAVKTNGAGNNILTYTLCTVTATKASSSDDSITVTFRLIGDTLHENGTAGHTAYVNWIATREYTFDTTADVTVYDVFTRALDGALLQYTGASKNYVSAITAPASYGGYEIGEFDNGEFSGWMYTLNGDHPNYGLQEQKLEDGDVVVWHYTDDYIAETEENAQYPCRWLEAEDTEPSYITAAIAIYELPETVTLNDKTAIEAARAAYDALSSTDQGYITAERLAKLTTAENDLARLESGPVVDVKDMTDVSESAWYYSDVAYVLAQGIMKGESPTTFNPNGDITRGQFVTILGRYAGMEDSSASNPATTSFTDVNQNQYYAAHVAWAAENGITTGTSATTFDPNAQISRQDMATMIGRFAKVMEIDLPDGDNATLFADDASIASYAKASVYSMVEAGIISGVGNNKFDPKATATRGQAAKIIHLLMEL